MMLSGGVPSTGRVLYGAREWARRARGLGTLEGLRADPAFMRFAAAGLIDLPRGAGRSLEAWLMAAAAGLMPGETADSVARAALAALRVPEAGRATLLAELARDMTRETPSRRRLFRLFVGRVARRRPLVLLPIVHVSSPLGVIEREAWGVTRISAGRVRVTRAGTPDKSEDMTAEELSDRFTAEHFA